MPAEQQDLCSRLVVWPDTLAGEDWEPCLVKIYFSCSLDSSGCLEAVQKAQEKMGVGRKDAEWHQLQEPEEGVAKDLWLMAAYKTREAEERMLSTYSVGWHSGGLAGAAGHRAR